jgi:hypothetical protein
MKKQDQRKRGIAMRGQCMNDYVPDWYIKFGHLNPIKVKEYVENFSAKYKITQKLAFEFLNDAYRYKSGIDRYSSFESLSRSAKKKLKGEQ